MPQLHFYVPEDIANKLREQAKAKNISLSKHIATIVQKETRLGWPEGYFEEVIGGWQGEPLVRPEQPKLEEHKTF
jgi:hypothetical protein